MWDLEFLPHYINLFSQDVACFQAFEGVFWVPLRWTSAYQPSCADF